MDDSRTELLYMQYQGGNQPLFMGKERKAATIVILAAKTSRQQKKLQLGQTQYTIEQKKNQDITSE